MMNAVTYGLRTARGSDASSAGYTRSKIRMSCLGEVFRMQECSHVWVDYGDYFMCVKCRCKKGKYIDRGGT